MNSRFPISDYASLRFTTPASDETKPIGAWLHKHPHWLLSGPAGMGKSMLLRWLIVGLANPDATWFPDREALPTQVLQPFRVLLHKLNHEAPLTSLDDYLRVGLRQAMIPESLFADRLSHTHRALAAGQLCVMLDGLDDLATHEHQASFLRVLPLFQDTPSKIIVTLREWPKWFIDSSLQPENIPTLVAAPLAFDTITRFIAAWYQERRYSSDPETDALHERRERLHNLLREDFRLRHLAQVPVNLLSMVMAHGRRRPPPDNQDAYYHAVIAGHLAVRPTPNPATVDEIVPQLAALYAGDNVPWGEPLPREELLGRLAKGRARLRRPSPVDRRSPEDFLAVMGYVGLLHTPAMNPERQHDADGWGFHKHLRALYDWVGAAAERMTTTDDEDKEEHPEERRYEPVQESMHYGTM